MFTQFKMGNLPNTKIVVKNAVKRRKGYLYYIDNKGNLCEARHKGRDEFTELIKDKIEMIENDKKKRQKTSNI